MFSTEIIQLFRDGQKLFNDLVFSDLDSIKQSHTLLSYVSLALAGFLYGIVHAIGPGHGKIVVSSYVLANENSLKRGLFVVALSSLLQALTAITLVLGFFYLLGQTRTDAEHAASLLEIGSFALVGCIGLGLCAQGLKDLVKIYLPPRPATHAHPAHTHSCSCCSCGHAHAPQPDKINNAQGIAPLVAMIISIGIRPCTGALLLLFFACMAGLALPGVLATLTMATGTALTTGALAFLAVKSKKLALTLVETSEHKLRLAHAVLRLLGGAAIITLAALFLSAPLTGESMQPPPPHPLYKSFH